MGNLVKTVEMRILADAGDAQARLDELDAKAKDLDGNSIKMRFRLDDTEGKAQLDAIKARAKTLGFEDVHIKVRVDGAGRAIADMEAIKHEMDSVDRRGILSRIGGLFGGAAGGIPGSVGPLPLPALAAGIPILGALATEAVGVAAGFAAAGAGAGAFALLAAPAVKQVTAAYEALNTTSDKYKAAEAKEAADPSKANKSAVQSAMVNMDLATQAVAKLPLSEQDAALGIQKLTGALGKMSKAFEPQAFMVFSSGLKVVNSLLPHVTPFANTFASGLDKLLMQAQKFTQSKGFSDWLKQFHGLEGPAIASIGHGIGEVANSFGKLMTIMSGKDVGHALNIAFGTISGTINVAASGIHRFMQNWDGMSAAAAKAGHAVAGAFGAIVGGAVSMQRSVDHVFSEVGSAIAHGVSTAVHVASELPGKIKGVFAGAAGWLVSAGADIIRGLLHGIESMAGSVIHAAEHIGSSIMGALHGIFNWGSPSKTMITKGQQIVQGLVIGLEGGQSALNAAATALGNTVAGPDSAITKAAVKLDTYVPKGDTGLTRWLKADSVKLQGLAKQRAAIESEIQTSEQVAQAEISNNSIINAAGVAQGGPLAPQATGDVITGMQQQLAQVKAFTAAVKQLKSEGLNATSLSQIIGAGSAGGLPTAQALLSGGKGAVAQINSLQKQLKASASQLGDASAGPMFQAGQQAAQGLAKGLKSQLGAIDSAMKQLADSMVNAIKKALKIKSPSLVFAEIGMQIPAGVAMGIDLGARSASAASARLAASTVQPWSGAGAHGGGGGLVVNFNGIVGDKYGTAQELHQVLRDYKRNRGNAPLGLG